MNRSFFILLVFLFVSSQTLAQEIKLVYADSIIGEYDHFSVDNFGRMYLCNQDVILQFSPQCDTLFSSSLKQLQPTSIESSKSMRTLVFDNERQVIHFFDNTLTDIHGEIDLVNSGIQQPILVCESFAGNTFWVLDAGTMRLIKLNNNIEIVSQTENLTTIFQNELLPDQMLESNDLLYVAIPGTGVAIFDVFGTYIKMLPCDPNHISVVDNYLLVRVENRIDVISTEGLFETEFSYKIPNDVTEFLFYNDKIYLLRKKGLFIGKYIEE